MFKISDCDVKITKTKKVSDKMTVGTLYTTYKEGKHSFIKTFIECKIVGNALKEFNKLGIRDKEDKFTIIEGVLKNEPYTKEGKEYNKNVITIFNLKAFEQRVYNEDMTPVEENVENF